MSDVIDIKGIAVDKAWRTLEYGGKTARLAPGPMEMLIVLAENFGRPISFDQLAVRFWAADPNGGPLGATDVMRNRVQFIRRALESIGAPITVRASQRYGYGLLERQ